MIISSEIIQGCLNRDRKYQNQLYRLCYSPLMKILYRYIYQEADAVEVINGAMMKVLTRLEQFKGDEHNFFGWIKQVAIREALDHIRKKPKFYTTNEFPEAIPMVDSSHSFSDSNAQEVQWMLRQLPPLTAAVFNLFVMEEYSHQEIAEQLSISVANSKWHLFSARKKLQSLIQVQNEVKL